MIVEKIIEKPIEVVQIVEVEKLVETVRTEIVEKIVEKPVYKTQIVEVPKVVEKVVYQDKYIEVEKVREVPMVSEKVVKVEKVVEVPIEVIKIQEVVKEVEKIVYQYGGKSKGTNGIGSGGSDSECDCLTSARLMSIWNKLFKLTGPTTTDCLTEEQFVTMISKNMNKNIKALSEFDVTSEQTNFASINGNL